MRDGVFGQERFVSFRVIRILGDVPAGRSVMSRGPNTFRKSDLVRALKGAKAAGVEVARIKIAKDGKIEIETISAPEAVGIFPKGKTNGMRRQRKRRSTFMATSTATANRVGISVAPASSRWHSPGSLGRRGLWPLMKTPQLGSPWKSAGEGVKPGSVRALAVSYFNSVGPNLNWSVLVSAR